MLASLALMGVAAAAPRPLKVEDYDRMQAIADPVCSADGRWVAYTVDSVDTGADEHRSRVWMVSADGTQQLPLSAPEHSAEKPRFSPDGRYVSFLATFTRPSYIRDRLQRYLDWYGRYLGRQ